MSVSGTGKIKGLVTGLLLTWSWAAGGALAAGTQYGEALKQEKATPIAAILADPDAYLGSTVRIKGGVLDVCPMKGCWMELGDDEHKLRVKVDDGVIVFPSDAKGRLAAAEGKLEAIEMTRDKYVAWLAHLAEERGETFDEAAAEIGDGPYRVFQIRGTGAVIETP